MRIRLGYVAIALKLPKVTSSSTVTYSRYSKIISEEEKLRKLKEVTLSNLNDLQKILEYNIKNNIHFYRITSNLVPLATHPDVNWDYRKYFKRDFEYIGGIIRKSNMRVDTHPDQFNVINSVNEKVVQDTIRNLHFHVNIFEDINYEEGKMIIHIGGGQGGKEESIKRFIDNFNRFPKTISEKLILENDDKLFTAKEVVNICKKLACPMVLDVHHHVCNNNEEDLEDLIEDIFDTWNNEILPPKIHFSSPKDGERDRRHSDYINPHDFISFIEMTKFLNRDYDVMIEAKKKDESLYKLVEDLKELKKEWKWIDESTIEI
jgi:UV DNA damage endonuclease